MKIKKFNNFLNEGILSDFFDIDNPDNHINKMHGSSQGALSSKLFKPLITKDHVGKIVDKRIIEKFLGNKYIIFVEIPNVGIEKIKVSANQYNEYQIGQSINLTSKELSPSRIS